MYYRQPRYFTDFHCIGGDCPDNCCYGWRIDWKAEEVDKLKSAPNMSEDLRELIEKSFVDNVGLKNQYMIEFDKRGKCPLLTDNGFCRIQRELGVEYMSNTCMVYPRHYILSDEIMYRYCNMSCHEVMRSLLNDEKSMALVNGQIRENFTVTAIRNTPELLKKHPELKYRGELLEFFYEIISDKKHSVEDSLILGALAAQKFSQYVQDGNYDLIPDAISGFKKQFHNPEQLKRIAEIKPNYNIKLGILAKAYDSLKSRNLSLTELTDSTGNFNIDLYLQGEQRLNESFKDRSFYLRNIALNLILELALPFKLTDNSIFENYSIFVAAFALFKLITIDTAEFTRRNESSGRVSSDKGISLNVTIKVDTDSYVCQACAKVSRDLCHNNNNTKDLLQFLKDKKMLSPAYLALLIK